MSYEIPKRAVDVATILAPIVAVLPYLISPESTNRALPRFVNMAHFIRLEFLSVEEIKAR